MSEWFIQWCISSIIFFIINHCVKKILFPQSKQIKGIDFGDGHIKKNAINSDGDLPL